MENSLDESSIQDYIEKLTVRDNKFENLISYETSQNGKPSTKKTDISRVFTICHTESVFISPDDSSDFLYESNLLTHFPKNNQFLNSFKSKIRIEKNNICSPMTTNRKSNGHLEFSTQDDIISTKFKAQNSKLQKENLTLRGNIDQLKNIINKFIEDNTKLYSELNKMKIQAEKVNFLI